MILVLPTTALTIFLKLKLRLAQVPLIQEQKKKVQDDPKKKHEEE